MTLSETPLSVSYSEPGISDTDCKQYLESLNLEIKTFTKKDKLSTQKEGKKKSATTNLTNYVTLIYNCIIISIRKASLLHYYKSAIKKI